MSITTTDSLSGRAPKHERCHRCGERSPRLTMNDMGEKLCDECAPSKLLIGRPVKG